MRILLVEDDRKTAAFVTRGLKEEGCVVHHVTTASEGRILALHEPFDVVVMDIMLPDGNGLAIIKAMRDASVTTPVLILSARGSVDDKVLGLSTGGDDYLAKPFAFSELLWRIHALNRRSQTAPSGTRLKVADLELDLLTRQVKRAGTVIDLQPREFALLEYLMRQSGRVVTKTMIMEHVWQYNFDPGTNVVESRMSRLRAKVDAPFGRPLIHTVRGAGYRLKAHDQED